MKIRKRLFIILSISVVFTVSVFSSMFGVSRTQVFFEEDALYETIKPYRSEMLETVTDIVATVNGVEIYLSEVIRIQANNKLNIEASIQQIENALKSGEIDQTTFNQRIKEISEESNIKSRSEILELLIRKELFYQEASKQGYYITFDEALAYEKALEEEMKANDPTAYANYYAYIGTLAKSFEMSNGEYIKTYIVPIRQKTLAIDSMIQSEFNKVVINESDYNSASILITNLYNKLHENANIIDFGLIR